MKTCRFCKYSLFKNVPETSTYIAKCKKHYIVDTVDGTHKYDDCEYRNPNGNCQDYKESFFRKLINKILWLKNNLIFII